MKIGLQIPNFTWPGGPMQLAATLRDVAQTADDGGLASLWVMDHFFQIPPVGAAELDMLEGYAALSYLAGITKRATLGTMVSGVTYRHPGVLVKTVSTLDVLSGGRAILGIGAAWFEREHRGLGVAFPPLRERFERLEEALQIAHQMWSGRVDRFDGKHYQLAETLCVPQPLARPRPPILIGGMGERKTLRLVAQYADACNLFTHAGMGAVEQKLDVLRRHCDALGRDYARIEKTSLATLRLDDDAASIAAAIATCRELAAAGIQHAIFNMPNVQQVKPVELLARRVLPEVRGL
jgi:F420-dependent oxidoreductase-like protein